MAPSHVGFKAKLPRLDDVFVGVWGASRTHSSLLRHKGEFVIRLLGCHRTQGQLAPGTKSVAGSPGNPRSSSFFAFPEYLLYSHSVDFLPLLLLLHMVECSLSLQESSWVHSLDSDSKFSGERVHWSNLDNVPTFGWGVGAAGWTYIAAAHDHVNGGGKVRTQKEDVGLII